MAQVVKQSACNAGDPGSIPGLERSPGEGNGNPLQYACLENPIDRGVWRATVHGVTKVWTRLSAEELMLLNCGVGQNSWESLGLQEIQLVPPKGDQSWVFIGRTDVEAKTPNTLATWCEELTHLKRPWCWERLKAGGEGDDRGWDDWMASLTQWTWVWVDSGSWWWTGRPGVLQSKTWLSDWTELSN